MSYSVSQPIGYTQPLSITVFEGAQRHEAHIKIFRVNGAKTLVWQDYGHAISGIQLATGLNYTVEAMTFSRIDPTQILLYGSADLPNFRGDAVGIYLKPSGAQPERAEAAVPATPQPESAPQMLAAVAGVTPTIEVGDAVVTRDQSCRDISGVASPNSSVHLMTWTTMYPYWITVNTLPATSSGSYFFRNCYTAAASGKTVKYKVVDAASGAESRIVEVIIGGGAQIPEPPSQEPEPEPEPAVPQPEPAFVPDTAEAPTTGRTMIVRIFPNMHTLHHHLGVLRDYVFTPEMHRRLHPLI